jgi:hypothetical protein
LWKIEAKAHDYSILLQPRAADCHMTHADLYSALFALISSQGKKKNCSLINSVYARGWIFIYFDLIKLSCSRQLRKSMQNL